MVKEAKFFRKQAAKAERMARSASDAEISQSFLNMAKAYLGPCGDPCDPLASPLYGVLEGLPPLLIQCGGRETILDDSVRFAERARNAGVAVELDVYPSMIHVFQAFGELSAARHSLAGAGSFLDRHFTEQKNGP